MSKIIASIITALLVFTGIVVSTPVYAQPTTKAVQVTPRDQFSLGGYLVRTFVNYNNTRTKKIGGKPVGGWCERNIYTAISNLGYKVKLYPTASSHGTRLKSMRGVWHKDVANAPAGSLIWWITSGQGHVAISLGNGTAVNNVGNRIMVMSVQWLSANSFSTYRAPSGWTYASDFGR